MSYVTGTLAVLFLIVVVVFSIQNLESTNVSLLFWSMSIPKILLILGTYLLGMVSGWGFVELIKRLYFAN
jgi:putative membrane protein